MGDGWRLPTATEAEKERAPAAKDWRQWFREDFLHSCFIGGSVAWDAFGAVAVRYALDPYRPGQGPAPLHVYAVVLGFLVASVATQVMLYRRWWPRRPAGRRRNGGAHS